MRCVFVNRTKRQTRSHKERNCEVGRRTHGEGDSHATAVDGQSVCPLPVGRVLLPYRFKKADRQPQVLHRLRIMPNARLAERVYLHWMVEEEGMREGVLKLDAQGQPMSSGRGLCADVHYPSPLYLANAPVNYSFPLQPGYAICFGLRILHHICIGLMSRTNYTGGHWARVIEGQ
jgi:hypothetical protein